jgi:hypothetical protein
MDVARLHAEIAAVCPIDGVSIADPGDRSAWRIDIHPNATSEQIAAAKSVVAAFDLDAPPTLTQSDYEAAIDRNLANVAAERGYKSEASILSYLNSSNAAWAEEAKAYTLWRDAVWAAAYAVLADVQSGHIKAPSPNELLSNLPAISWPPPEQIAMG